MYVCSMLLVQCSAMEKKKSMQFGYIIMSHPTVDVESFRVVLCVLLLEVELMETIVERDQTGLMDN